MPKPIVALCMAIVACMVSFEILSFETFQNYSKESYPEKSVPSAIICPPPVTISVPPGLCLVFVNIPLPISNDPNCPITFLSNSLTGLNNPSGIFSPQTFTLTWTVTDACNNTITCDQLVSITDNNAPVLVCPQNVVVPCGLHQSPPYINLQSFLGAGGLTSDNCLLDSLSFTLVSQVIVTQPLPIRVYSRVYRIRDIHNNLTTCMQTINITDVTPPMITCPPDISTGNSDDGRNTLVIVDMPVTSDNCGVQSVINNYNNTSDASDFYPVGTTLVDWTATDFAGNTATCQMAVIVFDNTPPEIICPDEESYECLDEIPTPYEDYLSFEAAGGDAMDETLLDTSSFALLDEFTDSMFCPEIITRVYVISDQAGNSATCSQEFIVDDETIPIISDPNPLPDIDCFNSLPLPQTLVAEDNCGNFEATGEVMPFTPNICNGYTVTHRWTASDGCGNPAEPVMVSFFVRPDIQGPIITPPQNITVQTQNNLCTANVTVPALLATDLCSQFSITNSFTNTANASGTYPLGTTQVVWTVTDVCANSNTATQTITVQDNQGPNLICKTNLVIALNDFINDQVPASFFIESATDNCGGDVEVTARRMVISCDEPTSNQFNSEVPFCCDDVTLQNIMVEVRARDARNNITTCMVAVDVQDNIAPIVHDTLPDISISCEYPLDLNDLSAFGTFVAEGETRADIIIPDYFYLPSGYAGMDGVYFDNCPDVTVSFEIINQLDMCNQGTIKRVFTIEDAMGNNVQFTQNIFVIDVNPFDENDIDWPDQQVFFNNCNVANPNPNITGKPVFQNDKCSQAAATYKDLTFPNNAYCKTIKRTWTVVDWCQYVPNTNIGKWTFDQYINVTNNVPPTIHAGVCDSLRTCTINGSCMGQLQLSASGTDDCLPVQITWTHKIDEGNNQTIDFTGSGSTINRPISRGTHRVIWEAKDKCGNVSSCQKIITIRECKAPTGIVHHGLAINLSAPMGMATIQASQFNNGSSDNCTPASQLKFSFSSNVQDVSRTYNCSHIGNQPIVIWITDLEGNQTLVNTYIIVQDNHNVCNNLNRITVAGMVRTIDLAPLSNTKIMIEGGETYFDQMTNESGKFCFSNLGMLNDYRVMGERKEEPLRGISTLDLVLIQRHILGIDPFIGPADLLAGDVDGSGKINTLDLVALRKLILGTVDTFPHQKPWIFVKESQEYLDPANPWIENLDFYFQNIDSSRQNTNFIGIKTGDVNRSYSKDLVQNNTENRSSELPGLVLEDIILKSGEITSVPVLAKGMRDILAKQFTLVLNEGMEYHGFEAKELPLQVEQIGKIQKNGKTYITCAFHVFDAITLEDSDILFNLMIQSKKDQRLSKSLSLSQEITPSKIYFENLESKPLQLQFIAPKRPDICYIKQNQPNPFKEETTLEFFLTEKNIVQVSVYDGSGKLIYKGTQEGYSGLNSWELGEKELGTTRGILFAKIKSGELNEVVKMLRIE